MLITDVGSENTGFPDFLKSASEPFVLVGYSLRVSSPAVDNFQVKNAKELTFKNVHYGFDSQNKKTAISLLKPQKGRRCIRKGPGGFIGPIRGPQFCRLRILLGRHVRCKWGSPADRDSAPKMGQSGNYRVGLLPSQLVIVKLLLCRVGS